MNRTLQQLGIAYTGSAGVSGFLTGLYVVLVPLAGFVLFKRRTGLTVWLGAVCALVGLSLLCLIFQTEKTLGEIGDKLPASDLDEVKAALEKLKTTAQGTDTEAIKADTEALEKAFYTLSEKLYKQTGAQGAGPDMGDMGGAGADGGDGTYYNADYEDKTENN